MSALENKKLPPPTFPNNVLTIKTVQIAPFRTLMTALKEMLVETNITFQADGMRIINMDRSHTILAYMHLPAANFEVYECKKEKIIVGVNMTNLVRLTNSVETEETLTMYIENADFDDGIVSYLTLKFENATTKQCKTSKLRLIEPEPEELPYPTVTFSSVINLPSLDFQKIIRDLSCISNKLEIKSVGNELIFYCSGQFASVEIRRMESEGTMGFQVKPEQSKIIQGEFSLKYLSIFTKCTPMCQQIELMLDNDLPLVVKYNVACLGEIKMCLAPLPLATTTDVNLP